LVTATRGLDDGGLTTPNRGVEDDLQMIDDLGLETFGCGTSTGESEQPKRPELSRRLPVVA
jgi:biotin synthase